MIRPPIRPIRLLLGLGLFALYCYTAAPTVGFEDAVGFALSCLRADITHAPGYPLYALLCHPLALVLPLNPAAAAAVFSALCAALACVVLSVIAGRLCGDNHAGILAALLYGVSAGLWSQATIPEVYALNALLFLTAFALAQRARDAPSPPLILLLAFVCALGLSNHWPLFVLAGAGLPLVLWPARRGVLFHLARPRIFLGAAAAVCAGLSPYLYMVWRVQNPESLMGLPLVIDDFSSFWEVVSRAVHSHSDEQGGTVLDKAAFLSYTGGEILWRQFSALGGALAAAGFILQWRRLPKTLAASLAVIFLTGTVLLIGLLGFIYNPEQRQIFSVYPLIPYAVVCIWISFAAAHWKRGGKIALAAACVWAAAANFSDNNRRHDFAAENITRAYFSALPEKISWMPPPHQYLVARYMQFAENIRPDVAVLPPPNPLTSEIYLAGPQLYPPNTLDYESELRLIAEYARENPLCYSTALPLRGEWHAEEYFIFSCLAEENRAVFDPKAAELIRFIIRGEPYPNIYGRNRIGKIVEDAARTMLRLQARLQLPEEWRALLQEAKQTPDGLLAELEFLAGMPDLVLTERRAEEYARAAERALPSLARLREIRLLAALGEVYAAVAPRSENSLAAAKQYYARTESLIRGNGGEFILPRLLDFYRRESLTAEEQALIAEHGAAALAPPQ